MLAKKNTCKKTGVSATRDAGDEIVCAAMRVLLLCAAFESCRSSVSLAVAFAGINLLFFFAFFTLRALLVLLYGFTTKVVCRVKVQSWFLINYPTMYKRKKRTFTFGRKTCLCQTNLLFRQQQKGTRASGVSEAHGTHSEAVFKICIKYAPERLGLGGAH